jgi:hypothetical protein
MQEVQFKQYRPDNKVFRRCNGDMVACLNFIGIIQSFRTGKGVPARFCRNVVASTKHPRRESSEQQRVRRRQQ